MTTTKLAILFCFLAGPAFAQADRVDPQVLSNFGGQGNPSVSIGSAAGTGGLVSIVGTNEKGIIVLTTGSNPNIGVYASISFDNSIPITVAPTSCAIQAQEINTGAQIAVAYPSIPTTSGWTINDNASPFPANISSFQWSYRCR